MTINDGRANALPNERYLRTRQIANCAKFPRKMTMVTNKTLPHMGKIPLFSTSDRCCSISQPIIKCSPHVCVNLRTIVRKLACSMCKFTHATWHLEWKRLIDDEYVEITNHNCKHNFSDFFTIITNLQKSMILYKILISFDNSFRNFDWRKIFSEKQVNWVCSRTNWKRRETDSFIRFYSAELAMWNYMNLPYVGKHLQVCNISLCVASNAYLFHIITQHVFRFPHYNYCKCYCWVEVFVFLSTLLSILRLWMCIKSEEHLHIVNWIRRTRAT